VRNVVRRGDAQTLSADVYEQLRSELLAGGYAPGERLVPAELCARYGVKAGVLREALSRLAAEGLTTLEPNRGFRVMDMTRRRIEELLELRRINECAALRLAVQRGGTDYEAAVVAAHHRLRATPEGPERGRAHHDFHLALLSACGNDRLLELCETLFEASELYRRWSLSAVRRPAGRGARNQDAEHKAILDAVLAHDPDRAAALYEQHLQRTVDLALTYAATLETAS
jgi:DNA-binding GntR family transcriptional regulator